MTDHLAAARVDLDHLEACNHGSRLSSAVARILDHLEAQRIDPQQLAASIRRGLDDVAAGRTEYLGRFTDDKPDPLDEDNHDDRLDRDGDRWIYKGSFWCTEGCYCATGVWGLAALNERYGPLTFAPRPAEPPVAAPQPDKAHGDAPDPAGPAERHTDNIRAEAWEKGHRAGFADGVHPDDHITPNPYRKDQA